jgi:hypothetical protein
MPHRIMFDEPIVVWLVKGQPEFGARRIRDVQEGRAALFRYGLESLRNGNHAERRVWAEAFHALLLAQNNPSPSSVSRARRALLRAAERADAVACADLLTDLIIRGFDFAP